MIKWTKTDDLQYVKKINREKYKIAEARYAEDKYILCKGEVDITEFMLEDGTYDSQCKSIINSYYESVEYFKECYADEETQNQILAEMIFESTPYYDTKYKIVSEDDVEQSLFDFMAEEVSERYEIELKKYSQSDIRFVIYLSLIHISEPTRRTPISYAVFCLKKKKTINTRI